ncbi:neugrin [Odontesthes bonariensis]|uniref:neugrin n=1 Tax=Odontesthes bonariensis TaxID=219752 RepID=UPI003F58388D
MARPLQVFSLIFRLRAPPVIPSVSVSSCRFASRGTNKAWMGKSHVHGDRGSNSPRNRDEMSDDELDLDDVDDKLQALLDEGRKRQKTVKYHILRRQMTPSGAPQRRLTWDAIEQIRYLKKEQPEEWTVERLAEGFSVAPDVILRVLKGNFTPSPDRKVRQDATVMTRLGQKVLPLGAGLSNDKLKLPGNRTPATLPFGRSEGALVPVSGQTQMIRGKGSESQVKSPAPVLPSNFTAGISKDVTEQISTVKGTPREGDEDDEEVWDGQVLTEGELEEYLEMVKPSPAVQVGNDFFDAEGNFLYRI